MIFFFSSIPFLLPQTISHHPPFLTLGQKAQCLCQCINCRIEHGLLYIICQAGRKGLESIVRSVRDAGVPRSPPERGRRPTQPAPREARRNTDSVFGGLCAPQRTTSLAPFPGPFLQTSEAFNTTIRQIPRLSILGLICLHHLLDSTTPTPWAFVIVIILVIILFAFLISSVHFTNHLTSIEQHTPTSHRGHNA